MKVPKRLLWQGVAFGSAMAVDALVRGAAVMSWQLLMHRDPPRNPDDPRVTWTDALLWGALLGLGAGVGRVVAYRASAAAWKRVAGRRPPYR